MAPKWDSIPNLIAIVVSIVSIVVAIISLCKSQRASRIATFLEYGTKEEIELKIQYLKEDEPKKVSETTGKYAEKIQQAKEEANRRGIFDSGIKNSDVKKLEQKRDKEIEEIKTKIRREIEILESKKALIQNL